jgi:hypothetical protein
MMRHLARRWQALTVEIKQLDKTLTNLIGWIAPPRLLAMQGVGTDVAGALLVAIGSNPERVHTERPFPVGRCSRFATVVDGNYAPFARPRALFAPSRRCFRRCAAECVEG